MIGGLSLDEPAADLAIMIALASSYLDAPVGSDLAAIGEVGLTGELRSVQSIGQRLCEVQRLGFHKCVVPWQKTDKLTGLDNLELIRVKTIGQAPQAVLENKKKPEARGIYALRLRISIRFLFPIVCCRLRFL